ncbi:Fe(3+)-hydroxamate ABC transporter permease FhuB [Caballeronia sp. LZ001]|uniref:Fe(3+)-hydroxamate ABC transporter permease FhuB n=1 Tax=Caballeronia sp. LZ001 TaxID=3038553 RepID=UPI00285F66A3|nr:Fe(3+)-hydroxamate ABC transporter permease FhuB [Caballeronia sp. LZ001]MDR5798683.1 Fe(3+)-hydroxamate ABC transporter permease FhuB [Caballeronia sp. LZ001]
MSRDLTALPGAQPPRDYRLALVGVLGLVALGLSIAGIHAELGGASFWSTVLAPDRTDLRQVLVRDSMLPRIAMTLLCGSALALAGTLAQQVLRNPLAEPMTLGIFPGAYLALMLAELWAPSLLADGRTAVALGGGALAMTLVFALAWRQRMSSLAVILSGMIVNLYCGAIALGITLAHFDLMCGLMIWGGGALDQTAWQDSAHLFLSVLACFAATVFMVRPLGVFEAGDSTVQGLGIALQRTRFAALLIAVVLTACVVSAVGVIGFVGLAAPTLARLAGARRLRQRLVWAPCLGAVLLWCTDEIVRLIAAGELFSAHLVPTGTVTSLLGVPLLLALLPRLRTQPDLHTVAIAHAPPAKLARRLPWAFVALAVVLTLCFCVSRGLDGGFVADKNEIAALMFWRLPHTVAALAAGVLLAIAGTLIQRVTANPMASPDLLGVSSGGALGIVVVLFAGLTSTPGALFGGCLAGAIVTLALLLWLGARASFAPERLLLIGVAISALFQAVVGALLASGDPRGGLLMNFVIGSTYYVEPSAAYSAAAIAIAGLALAPLMSRWLEALGLGTTIADGLGVPVVRARFAILILASVLTAASTLIVGPLSFVGLIAPHVARYSGARRPAMQMCVAAVFGALLMGLAEWLGRQIMFPEEMPAGLVATLIGGPYLIALTLRKSVSST